ncbi:unnamed protein product [Withania somnifera]
MSIIYGIQGQLLEVTVVCCNKLKDTEWISRQDPYVCLAYSSTEFRTRTCTGLREINVVVWNSNTITYDDFIGSGKIQLQKVLSTGYDDTAWPIQSKTGRHAGEVRLIMFYANANKPATSFAPSYTAPQAHESMSVPPPHVASYPAPTAYQTPSPYPAYPPHSAAYPPTPYPPQPTAYPPVYPPPSAYPPVTTPPLPAYPVGNPAP